MGFEITVRAGMDAQSSSVQATGSEQHVITDAEARTFGLDDNGLKNAVEKYFGHRPNDAYLHSCDMDWGDLYQRYGWTQVQTNIYVASAMITSITSEPVIVAKNQLANHSSADGVFDASISQTVTNTTVESWSISDSIQVSQSIKYNIGFLGTGGGGETSFSYAHQWGKGGSESKQITVGSATGVHVTLKPGQEVEAQLTANRGVMKIRVTYAISIDGQTAVNYNPTWKDHHFWGLWLGAVMSAAGLATTRYYSEDIEVGFYSNSRVEIRDLTGQLQHVLALGAVAGPMAVPEEELVPAGG